MTRSTASASERTVRTYVLPATSAVGRSAIVDPPYSNGSPGAMSTVSRAPAPNIPSVEIATRDDVSNVISRQIGPGSPAGSVAAASSDAAPFGPLAPPNSRPPMRASGRRLVSSTSAVRPRSAPSGATSARLGTPLTGAATTSSATVRERSTSISLIATGAWVSAARSDRIPLVAPSWSSSSVACAR